MAAMVARNSMSLREAWNPDYFLEEKNLKKNPESLLLGRTPNTKHIKENIHRTHRGLEGPEPFGDYKCVYWMNTAGVRNQFHRS